MIPTSESRPGDTAAQVGVVVEDYADTVIDNSELGLGLGLGQGQDWAPVLRWAIALDDGHVVFAAEGDSSSLDLRHQGGVSSFSSNGE